MAMAMALQQPILLGVQERSSRVGRTPAPAASCGALSGIGGRTLRPCSAQRRPAGRTVVLRVKAATSNAEASTSSSSSSSGNKEIIPDSEITITKVRFGTERISGLPFSLGSDPGFLIGRNSSIPSRKCKQSTARASESDSDTSSAV